MSASTGTPGLLDGESGVLPTKPKWQVLLEEQLEPDASDIEMALLVIMRTLLAAPDDDTSVTDRSIQHIRKYYTDKCQEEECTWMQSPDHGVEALFHGISYFAFELASEIPFTDPRHERLAYLLVGLRDTASSAFAEAVRMS
jgi:hypothetical protein